MKNKKRNAQVQKQMMKEIKLLRSIKELKAKVIKKER
jgi:hypothetical protein